MRGGSDDLDAALVGAVVGARPLKGGQEGVVDVDGVPPVALAKLAAEDLQAVAGGQQQQQGEAGGSTRVRGGSRQR